MRNRPTSCTPSVIVVVTGALLAVAPVASAQGPPPPVPPPPPGVGDEPPDTSSGPQPTGNNTPPLTSSTGPSILPKPGKPVSMAGTSALRGRVLRVGLSCTQNGTVKVSFRGKRAGKARFRCVSSKATARVRLGRKAYARLKRASKPSLKVTARAGGTKVTRVLRFKRSGRGFARTAAWARGPHGYFNATGYCDFDVDHERTLYSFTGLLVSSLPGGDHYWMRYWAYTEGYGWQQMTDWWGAHEVPQEGIGGFKWVSSPLFYPAKQKWTAGYMELWSYRYGRSWGDYLETDQLGGGGLTVTSGIWCYSKL